MTKCMYACRVALVTILLTFLIILVTPCTALFAVDTDQAVTYQINASHNGSIETAPQLVPPLMKKWSIDLGSTVSYPLIAEGKVFVTVRNTSYYGTKLYAINAITGTIAWGPIEIPGTYYWSAAAYGDGRIYVINFDGRMRAFNAGDGQEIWNVQMPGQYAFTSPPTFYKGIVYTGGAGGGGTLYAVNAATGAVIWTNYVTNGDHSSPAVTDDGVYVTYACGVSTKFNPINGQRIWSHTTGCSGGGGKTPVFYEGRLYSRDHYPGWNGFVLDTANGSYLGEYYTQTTPAFYNGSGYLLYANALQRLNLSTRSIIWSRAVGSNFVTPPIIVNGYVYAGTNDGVLYAVDPNNGEVVWSDIVGHSILASDEHNVIAPVAAMGAGEGIIVVPASNWLVAYKPANHEPEASCTQPVTVECDQGGETTVVLTADVSDVDGDALMVKWSVDGVIVQTDNVADSGESATTASLNMTHTYPLGTHTVSVEVSDEVNPAVTVSTSVTVRDTTAPRFMIQAQPTVLTPANGLMVPIMLSMIISEAGDPNPRFETFTYSDEDDFAGKAGKKLSPDAISGSLRAECDPNGDGRVYLMVVKATDASGNTSFKCYTVIVPKSSSAKAIAKVEAQAQQAVNWCLAKNGSAPDGYWVVGDAPQTK